MLRESDITSRHCADAISFDCSIRVMSTLCSESTMREMSERLTNGHAVGHHRGIGFNASRTMGVVLLFFPHQHLKKSFRDDPVLRFSGYLVDFSQMRGHHGRSSCKFIV